LIHSSTKEGELFMKKAYLVFEDGTVFEGYGFGAERHGAGEAVFCTSVVGYLEALTDPCYAGQILVQTFPLIGNYGVIEEDLAGKCCLSGYVVREWCDTPSNFRCQYDLDAYLKQQGVPGIYGVDTRAITRKIRDCGVMKAMICEKVPELWSASTGVVFASVAAEAKEYAAKGDEKYHAVLVNNGAACFLLDELCSRNCKVTVVSPNTPAEDILAMKPDGIALSEGPGNPEDYSGCIELGKALMGKVPMMGVGLGHQIMALASGAAVKKMKYGHRGGNQPVRDLAGNCTYITGQNHGYEVISDSVINGTVRFVNANDGGCEGIDYPEMNAFSVQFRPEGISGPMCTAFIFDQFISMMGGESACR
jgi:carbamoyl-phosphate synthase small subunit